jgi:hypothetical protein
MDRRSSNKPAAYSVKKEKFQYIQENMDRRSWNKI